MFDLEQLWDGWPSRKFLRKRVSKDKAYWKVLCWFVGSVIDYGSKQSWLSRSQKWLPMEGSEGWRVLANKDVECSATAWNVIVWEPLRCKKLGILQMILEQTSLPVWYDSRMNQAKAGGHVTPRVNYTRIREIGLCRYGIAQLRMT